MSHNHHQSIKTLQKITVNNFCCTGKEITKVLFMGSETENNTLSYPPGSSVSLIFVYYAMFVQL